MRPPRNKQDWIEFSLIVLMIGLMLFLVASPGAHADGLSTLTSTLSASSFTGDNTQCFH